MINGRNRARLEDVEAMWASEWGLMFGGYVGTIWAKRRRALCMFIGTRLCVVSRCG